LILAVNSSLLSADSDDNRHRHYSDRVDSSRAEADSASIDLVLGGKQNDDRGEGKAATYERLTCEWALYMKQIEQSEQHGCLRGDATERGKSTALDR